MKKTPATLELNGNSVALTLRRSKRAKRLSLQLNSHHDVCIVAPLSAADSVIEDFLARSRPWLKRNHAKLLASLDQSVLAPKFDDRHARVAIFGEMQSIQIQSSGVTTAHLKKLSDGYLLNVPANLTPRHERGLLADALKKELSSFIAAALDKYQNEMRLYPKCIRIKTQKSRWGSCSRLGNINLNWRLVHAPRPVIEYVLVHELCHLRHHDHSEKFWHLVAQHSPDFSSHRQWLKNNGAVVMAAFG